MREQETHGGRDTELRRPESEPFSVVFFLPKEPVPDTPLLIDPPPTLCPSICSKDQPGRLLTSPFPRPFRQLRRCISKNTPALLPASRLGSPAAEREAMPPDAISLAISSASQFDGRVDFLIQRTDPLGPPAGQSKQGYETKVTLQCRH